MSSNLQYILNQPNLLASVSNEELQEWVQHYPFVSLFQLELYKRQPNDQQKLTTSFYLTDRTVLLDWDTTISNNSQNFEKENILENFIIEEKNPIIPSTTATTIASPNEHPTINTTDDYVAEIEDNKDKKIIEDIKADEKITTQPLSLADQILLELSAIKQQRIEEEEIKLRKQTSIQEEIAVDKSEKVIQQQLLATDENRINIDDLEQQEIKIEETQPQQDIIIVPDKKTPTIIIDDEIATFSSEEEIKINTNTTHLLEIQVLPTIQVLNQPILTSNNTIEEEKNNANENIIESITLDKETAKIEETIATPTLSLADQILQEIEAIKQQRALEQEEQHSLQANKQEIAEEKISNTTEPTHTFLEWLSIIDKKQHLQETTLIETQPYETKFLQENKELLSSSSLEGEYDSEDEIDEDVNKLAGESIAFKQDMMTETLALIYLKQGKIEKAIAVYQNLIQKNPEKSAIFVAQIENLKKLL